MKKSRIFRLAPRGWTDAGTPIYDIADAKLVFSGPDSYMINSLHTTPDNKLIVCYNFEQWGKSPDTVACYDFEGKRLWSIARTDPWIEPSPQSTMVHATGAIYDFNIPKLGNVFGTWLYHGNKRPYLVTTDGLYVGTMMEDTMLGPTSLRGESACYYYQAPNGAPYLINGANQAEHIFKISGLDPGSVGRFEGAYQVSEADVQKAAEMRAVPEIKAPPKPVIGVSWLKKAPVIDGSLSGWNMSSGVTLDGGNGRTAEVALGRDEQNLYLAYKVHERNPMRNGGADWQSLFITGDCVDLMLQCDSKADPKRRNAVVGDQRLLLTLFQDKPVAVLYRPVVPGTASPVHLASAQIDQVIKLDSAKVVITRDVEHSSYVVEASVPLKDLGINAKEPGELRGDAGVIFADETGKGRSLRLYYYNKNTQMVNDLATEATLQPGEWGKIAMPLGPNLVKNGGFEEPLVASREDADKGWFVGTAANGSEAVLSEESPFTGLHSLLMQTTVPVSFPQDAYNDPDYTRFIKCANGGKGGGEAMIMQKVPVVAGHEYSLRYRYRCEEMQPERRQPGHPRGYILFRARLDWLCTPPFKAPSIGTGNQGNSMAEWQTVHDFYDQPWLFSKTYLAPEGATGAMLAFQLSTLAADHMPKLFLDNVEFVDLATRSSGTLN